jgi:peptidoglycan L-alanyl-D-glutamate endopeptidase CwlK
LPQPMFNLSNKSRQKLEDVHPDLVGVVERAIKISDQDFSVLEGLRTVSRQRQLLAKGATTTMNSRHITGHAVDLVPYPLTWDRDYFYPIADAMKAAARELGIPLEWGGDWKSFKDGPHFQLPWHEYP